MAPVPSVLEEQMIAKAVQEDLTWEKLPKRLKLFLGTNEEWLKHVKEQCMRKRLRWSDSPARNACKEAEYYEGLVAHLKKKQAAFPYHLADYLCRVMRISPFRYYIDLLYDVMRNERPYDTIPNFSAADALRETGIGRNHFIDIMNKARSKLMWKLNRSFLKELLPTQPAEFPIELDWHVCTVNLTTEEHRRLSEEELGVVERCGKEGGALAGDFDLPMVRQLYRKGLVYFDVPVFPHDRFQVRSLEGFVSNRDQQHEDHTEELLYALFLASSDQTTVVELANTLQADLAQLEAAVSLACRLGWAHKVVDFDNVLDGGGGGGDAPERDAAPAPDAFRTPSEQPGGALRFALMVDANLTSFLMMGSFSHSLKQQAVTLFEAGKLGDRSVGDLCEDLRSVENTHMEGELQHFADHAASLRCALSCLRMGKVPEQGVEDSREALLSATSWQEQGLLEGVGVGPGAFLEGPSLLGGAGGSGEESPLGGGRGGPLGEGPGSGVAEEDDFGAYSSISLATPRPGHREAPGEGAELQGLDDEDVWASTPARALQLPVPGPSPELSWTSPSLLDADLDRSGGSQLGSIDPGGSSRSTGGGPGGAGRRGKARVEVLRCESLAGLPSETLQRLLRRDYNVVVSMIPLPAPLSVVSPDGTGPVHFGPPSKAAITPWLKLLMYTAAGAGPVTVVLVRGQRLRQLPPPLGGCWKALLWTWDGTSVGGVGGREEGSLVPGAILLHVLNQLLRTSAVLVQPLPLGSPSLDAQGTRPVTATVPLPLSGPVSKSLLGSLGSLQEEPQRPPSQEEAWEGAAGGQQPRWQAHPVVQRVAEQLGLRTVGFLRMLRVDPAAVGDASLAGGSRGSGCDWVPHSLHLGIPLFDTDLCRQVCEGALQEEIFEAGALEQQRQVMLALRKRLASFIGDYRAAGKVPRASFRGHRRLLRRASSRWARARTVLHALEVVTPRRSVAGPTHLPSPRVQQQQQQQQRRAARIAGAEAGDPFRDGRKILGGRRFVQAVNEVDEEEEEEGERAGEEDPMAEQHDITEQDIELQVPLPGVNLLFDGAYLVPFNLESYVQGRLPAALVAETNYH